MVSLFLTRYCYFASYSRAKGLARETRCGDISADIAELAGTFIKHDVNSNYYSHSVRVTYLKIGHAYGM